MNGKKTICITTVVDKNYQRYIPWFCWFVKENIPIADVKIFYHDAVLDFNPAILPDNTVIIRNSFADFPKSNQELKMLRWILPKAIFSNYTFAYIGDIDILITDFFLNSSHFLNTYREGTCFSNIIRPNQKRLTGLHYINVKDYYEAMNPTIEKYTNLLLNGKLKSAKNECVLYDMITEAGLKIPQNNYRPHHGVHLGIWRKRNPVLSEEKWDAIGGKLKYKEYYERFKNTFEKLKYKNLPKLPEFKYMKECLEKL